MIGKLKAIWYHPWVAAAKNLLLIMLIYTLLRIFFYLANRDLYADISTSHLMELLLGGVRFDLTALLYLNSVYLLMMLLPLPMQVRTHRIYNNIAAGFYIIPNIIGVILNLMDTVYVRFSDRRTTCTIFTEFDHDNNLGSIFLQAAAQYWYVTLVGLVIIALIILCFQRPRPSHWPSNLGQRAPWIYYPAATLVMCLSIYFIVIGIRGGFGAYTRPITISNALQYTDKPQETAIVLNTPFSLMKSLENETYVDPHYFAPDELETIMSPLHTPSLPSTSYLLPSTSYLLPSTSHLLPSNVVVFILESFSKEYLGYFNHHLDNGTYQGYTPFLDSLLAHSITYTESFASGRKSIDAMPSVLSSIPMLIEPYIVTPYSTNEVSSIADCLGQIGYQTAFFHGAPNGSMGFEAYARSAGFDAYYGMNEYDGPDAFDGTWAIWDEEFLQYYARTMSTMQEPFMTAVFTASSHHPFRIPERYEGAFDKGTHPLHQCIGYSDMALRRFFETAAQEPWYDNTLFVLTADHTNQLTHDEYLNARGYYEIPIAFYSPAWDKTREYTAHTDSQTIVSQIDIMPSVLSYIGYDQPYFSFGEDVLTQPKQHNYAVCYNHPVYQMFTRDLTIQFDGEKATCVTHAGTIGEPQPQEEQLTYLKAFIQQYISRMINNNLTYGSPCR